MKPPTCTDCKVIMQPGYTANGASYVLPATEIHWYPGQPQRAFGLGVKGAIQIDSQSAAQVMAFRCELCHQLKFITSAS